MALPHSTRQAWVVKSVAVGKTNTADLKPFELGIFDYEACKAVNGFQNSPYIKLAYGSPNQKSRVSSSPKVNPLIDRNQAVSFKTDKIYGKELLPARVAKPGKVSKGMTATIGWDGINDCTSLDFKPGETYLLTIKLYGSAAKLAFGKEVQDTITITMPAEDECAVTCTKPNLCYLVVDELVTKINNSWVAPGVVAEKLLSCCDTIPVAKTYCREWTITVCDEGNEMTLASIQNQYPTSTIYIKEKVGSMTTYALVQDDTLAAPANYVQSDVKIVNCENCPAGYTTTAVGKILVVEIDNDGLATTDAAALTEVQTKIPTATKAVKTGFTFGTSTYIVTVPTAWVMPAPIADTKITDTGKLSPKVCTLTTPVSTAWVQGEQTYRVKRSLQITVDNPDCAGSDLAEIVATYSKFPDVIPASIVVKETGSCKTIFTLDQNSNCMEDGCDTIAVAAFKDLPSFKGHTWMVDLCEGWTVSGTGCPIPPAATINRDCRCGVKLSGATVDVTSRSCVFNPNDAVNYDPIFFEVSIMELMPVGEPGGTRLLDPKRVPVVVNRSVTRKYLTGQEVARDVLEYRFYRQNERFFSPDAFEGAYRFNEAEGQRLGVDVNKFYYAVYIYHDKLGRQWNQTMDMASRTELALYFEESDYSAMLQFLAQYNAYAMSAGISLPAIVI